MCVWGSNLKQNESWQGLVTAQRTGPDQFLILMGRARDRLAGFGWLAGGRNEEDGLGE